MLGIEDGFGKVSQGQPANATVIILDKFSIGLFALLLGHFVIFADFSGVLQKIVVIGGATFGLFAISRPDLQCIARALGSA